MCQIPLPNKYQLYSGQSSSLLMKASCMRLKLVEVTSLQVSMLTIRIILMYLMYLITKEEISKIVTLPYFNPNSSITLQTDASKKGLGTVLLQNSKPVMFVSRALTGNERKYQNLERECLD